ncbi:MAG: lysylphosphatidylglycerol synthase transmembrane domain-containing protein [Halovenus sp.]
MGDRVSSRSVREFLARRWLSLLGTGLVLVAGVALAARTVETDQVIDAFRVGEPGILALAVGVYVLSWPLRGHRYDDILAAMGRRCGGGFLTAAVFVSQLANLVVPARAGDGVRAHLLKTRKDVPYTTGAASLTVERLFDLLALVSFAAVALVWLVASGRTVAPGRSRTVLVGAAVVGTVGVCLTGAIVLVARSGWRPAGRMEEWVDGARFARVVEALSRFGTDVGAVATDSRALARISLGSLAVWALDVLTAVLVVRTVVGSGILQAPALLAVGMLAVTVGNLAKVLPLSQGGIGLYEAAFTAIVVAVAPIGAATALAAAILDHAIKNAVTVAGGAVAALGLSVSREALGRERELPESEPSDF